VVAPCGSAKKYCIGTILGLFLDESLFMLEV